MIYFANYNKAVKTAVEVLEDYDIPQAPVDLQIIFNALCREIALITYNEFMEYTGKTYNEVIRFFDSEMGACCYNPQTSQYIIYYNAALSESWTRFTLAHELGHIFLGHHQKAGTEILNRTFISKRTYNEYEKEANAFARNLLSPAPLAWLAIDEGDSKNPNYDLEIAFDITESAANVRVKMIHRDLRDYSSEMKSIVSKIYLRYQRSCPKCKARLSPASKYCMICGNAQLGKNLWFASMPPDIPLNESGTFERCPCCGNGNITRNSNYCRICGTPIKNICLGNIHDGRTYEKHYNRSFAMFCEECGSPTIYKYRGITIRMEDEEMQYNDGVEYDEESLRVKKCPVCNNEEFSEEAEFCRICGTNLYNKCEGEEQDSGFSGIFYNNQHSNPSNARFCEICGKPTYFLLQNILTDYKSYLQKTDAQFEKDMALAKQVKASAPVEESYNSFESLPFENDVAEDDELPFN